MKLKSLILGSAAALVMGAGAQAADLPADPVDYVQICDQYGAGFYVLPGTDSCYRARGRVRVEYRIPLDGGDATTNTTNRYRTRARGYVRYDVRKETDMGTLQAAASLHMTVGPTGTGRYTQGTSLEYGYIKFANLTVGRIWSAFSNFTGYGIGNTSYGDNYTEVNVLQYTMALGEGMNATISLEDPTSESFLTRHRGVSTSTPGTDAAGNPSTSTSGTSFGGITMPDIIVKLSGSAGGASYALSGVVGQIASPFDAVSRKNGWAVQGSVEATLTDDGVKAALVGAYANGLTRYITSAGYGHVDNSLTASTATGTTLAKGWSIAGGIYAPVGDGMAVSLQGVYDNQSITVGGTKTSNKGIGGDITLHYNIDPDLYIGLNVGYAKRTAKVGTAASTDAKAGAATLRFQRSF